MSHVLLVNYKIKLNDGAVNSNKISATLNHSIYIKRWYGIWLYNIIIIYYYLFLLNTDMAQSIVVIVFTILRYLQ